MNRFNSNINYLNTISSIRKKHLIDGVGLVETLKENNEQSRLPTVLLHYYYYFARRAERKFLIFHNYPEGSRLENKLVDKLVCR